MQIEDVIKAKEEMESAIKDFVSEAVQEFYSKTGLCPQSIGIDFAKVNCVGDPRTKFIVTDAHADVVL